MGRTELRIAVVTWIEMTYYRATPSSRRARP